MFEFFGKMFDAYTLKARLMPGLFLLLPIVLSLVAWFPDQLSAVSTFGAIIVLLGGASILSQVVRDKGKELEKELFKSWGGSPSVALLRHRDEGLNSHTKSRCHKLLKHFLPDIKIPNAKEEMENPDKADMAYDACCHFLREKSRDPDKFQHLLAENTSYGTRRNLLGMRPAGIFVALLGTACSVAAVMWNIESVTSREPAVAAVLVCAFCCAVWSMRITPSWVRIPANAYAERLISVCEQLELKTPAK